MSVFRILFNVDPLNLLSLSFGFFSYSMLPKFLFVRRVNRANFIASQKHVLDIVNENYFNIKTGDLNISDADR